MDSLRDIDKLGNVHFKVPTRDKSPQPQSAKKRNTSPEVVSRNRSLSPTQKKGPTLPANSQKLRFYELVAEKSPEDIHKEHIRLLEARTKYRNSLAPKEKLLISGHGRHPRPPIEME